jgi:hypothetical protein
MHPMEDDELTSLYNACTDLVGLRKYEAFLRGLIETRRSSEWVRVGEFCSQLGLSPCDLTPDLFATWLPDPMADAGYVVILFYEDESKWSMAAHYNRARLMAGTSQKPDFRSAKTPN